jgi:hypothetical protein
MDDHFQRPLWLISKFLSKLVTVLENDNCCPARNHVKLGVSLKVLYCVVDTGYGLGRSQGNCRPALPKGRKYQMVKTQTESHIRRPVV